MPDDTEEKETQGDEAEAPEPAAASDPEAAAESVAEATVEAGEEPEASTAEAASAEEPAAEQRAPAPAKADRAAAPARQHTYQDLHVMNVGQLREVAATLDHEAVHGYSTMHKEHLLPAICKAIGIEAHEHHEVVGIDKDSVKAKIRVLKRERDEAEAAGDKARLKVTRRRIRSLKRKIRKATV